MNDAAGRELGGRLNIFLDILIVGSISSIIGAAIGWLIHRAGGPKLYDNQIWVAAWFIGPWAFLTQILPKLLHP